MVKCRYCSVYRSTFQYFCSQSNGHKLSTDKAKLAGFSGGTRALLFRFSKFEICHRNFRESEFPVNVKLPYGDFLVLHCPSPIAHYKMAAIKKFCRNIVKMKSIEKRWWIAALFGQGVLERKRWACLTSSSRPLIVNVKLTRAESLLLFKFHL